MCNIKHISKDQELRIPLPRMEFQALLFTVLKWCTTPANSCFYITLKNVDQRRGKAAAEPGPWWRQAGKEAWACQPAIRHAPLLPNISCLQRLCYKKMTGCSALYNNIIYKNQIIWAENNTQRKDRRKGIFEWKVTACLTKVVYLSVTSFFLKWLFCPFAFNGRLYARRICTPNWIISTIVRCLGCG